MTFLNANDWYKVDSSDEAAIAKLNEKGYYFVSPMHEINLKTHTSQWRNNSDKWRSAQKKLKKKKATFSGLAKRVLGFAAIQTPKTSQLNSAVMMHLSRMATILHFDLTKKDILGDDNNEYISKITKSSLEETSVGNYILDLAAEITLQQRSKLLDDHNSVPFLGVDKGPSGDFVKIIAQYNTKAKKVQLFVLDNEKSGGTNEEAAESIRYSVD